jgi:xanthine dehydrogenase iron-sulfur cluster and FAD-binding subunit A
VWHGYETPASVDGTLRRLADYGPGARLIAGGTDLLVELRRAPRPELTLIDVSRIERLDRVWLDDKDWIHIGPAVTHNQAAASSLLARRGIPLAQASAQLGTPQVRNRATIAGNLVTASPANDAIAALWALDARLTLRSLRGPRTLSFPDFYLGVRRTARADDEMVTDISFPALRPDERGAFVKLGLRCANAISVANAALVLAFRGDSVTEARIALGSVAPTIMRAAEAEASLLGGPLSEERIQAAAAVAAQAAVPITDVRGSAPFRREAVRILVRRALETLREDSGAPPAAPPLLWGQTNGHFPFWTPPSAAYGDAREHAIECTVNGKPFVVQGANRKRLIDMLRDDVGLTGTKEGCGEGECGACTIWMDGIAVLACLIPAPRAQGTNLVTIEGLAKGETLHPLQQAFIDEGAVQCGYCTPGFIMAGASMLDEMPLLTQGQIRAGLSGNLCRCTGYYTIVKAVERAMTERNAADLQEERL